MKLISLNTWGGKIYQPLIDFIKQNSKDTDIFCFQEVFDTKSEIADSSGFRLNLYKELSQILPNHQGYFASALENYIAGSFQPDFIDFNLFWGLAIFTNKNLKVITQGDFFVYGKRGSFDPKDLTSVPRNVQYLTFKNGKTFTICNLHGIWIKGNKGDTPSRISQSKQIKDFLNKKAGEKILVGDLNLSINTESIEILEEDLRNLIREYNIKTTRNKHFPGEEKFADYTFVSPGVSVKSFQVPDVEISDHLPMILEFT